MFLAATELFCQCLRTLDEDALNHWLPAESHPLTVLADPNDKMGIYGYWNISRCYNSA